jgi:hypothetical protein
MGARRSASMVQDGRRPPDAAVVLLRMSRFLDCGKNQKTDNLFP